MSRYNSTRDKYRRVQSERANTQPIQENEIRVSAKRGVAPYIRYALGILTSDGKDTVIVQSSGGAIPIGCLIAEIVRRRVPDLHQLNKISSTEIEDVYEPVEEGLDRITIKKTMAVLRITLTKKGETLDHKDPGYQPPLPESEVRGLEPRADDRPRTSGDRRGGDRRGGRGGRFGGNGGGRGGRFNDREGGERRYNDREGGERRDNRGEGGEGGYQGQRRGGGGYRRGGGDREEGHGGGYGGGYGGRGRGGGGYRRGGGDREEGGERRERRERPEGGFQTGRRVTRGGYRGGQDRPEPHARPGTQ